MLQALPTTTLTCVSHPAPPVPPPSVQGDSGFVIFRGKKVIARSKPLQHYFDCPLQFGAHPEYVDATDTAEQADLYQVAVQPGDIIVAGASRLGGREAEGKDAQECPTQEWGERRGAPGALQPREEVVAALHYARKRRSVNNTMASHGPW